MRAGSFYFGLSIVLIVCLVQHNVTAKPYNRYIPGTITQFVNDAKRRDYNRQPLTGCDSTIPGLRMQERERYIKGCLSQSLRVKRVSDQRLAELETLVALSKMSGKLVTVPLAYGKLDPKFIGRRRRSEKRLLDSLFNRSSNEESAEADPPEISYDDLMYR